MTCTLFLRYTGRGKCEVKNRDTSSLKFLFIVGTNSKELPIR